MYLKAIILGIVEGATEFLPISSTGHLILMGHALEFTGEQAATFSVAIQLGAILAVVIVYRQFFLELFALKTRRAWRRIFLISCTTLPALIAGALLHEWVKSLFTPLTVAAALFTGGVLMLIVEKLIKPKAKIFEIDDMTTKQALIIGVSQCVALWPGMSRSASTIIGGILSGLDYELAAKYSFIAAVPIMFAAFAFEILTNFNHLSSEGLSLIGVGFVTSFITAFFAIVGFLKILKKYKFTPFAIYRIALSIIVIYVLF